MNNRTMCPICEEKCWSDDCCSVSEGYAFSAFVCKHTNRLFYIDNQLTNMGNLEIGQFYYTLIVDDLLERKYSDRRFPHYCLGKTEKDGGESDVYVDVTKIPIPINHFDKVDRSLMNICRLYGESTFNLNTVIGMRCLLCTKDEERLARENSLLNFGYITKTNSRNDSEKYIISKEGWQRLDEMRRKNSDKTGFIAISFGDETKEIREALKSSISECGFEPVLINEKEHNNQIVPEIRKCIQKCRFLVMDCSEPNHGAYYEAGMAVGYGKEVIICCNKERFHDKNTRPHFDIAQQSMVLWKDLEDLKDKLMNRILHTVDGAKESKDDGQH